MPHGDVQIYGILQYEVHSFESCAEICVLARAIALYVGGFSQYVPEALITDRIVCRKC